MVKIKKWETVALDDAAVFLLAPRYGDVSYDKVNAYHGRVENPVRVF